MGMMRRRARRRGLVRATVGTAAVVGTAGAVRHHQAKKWAKEDQQAYAEQQYEQQQYAPEPEPEYYDEPAPAPAPAAAADPGLADQLQQLAQLHESGVLDDEEFAAAKQKLLAG